MNKLKNKKIIAIADIHGMGLPYNIGLGDVLNIAGDITGFCTPTDYKTQYKQVGNLFDDIRFITKEFKKVGTKPWEHIVIGAGNHDSIFDYYGHGYSDTWEKYNKLVIDLAEEFKKEMEKEGINIHFGFSAPEIIKVGDLNVLISPYSNAVSPNDPWGFHWDTLMINDEEAMLELEKEIKDSQSVDIVISHAPVNGILDEVNHGGNIKNVGDDILYDILNDNNKLPELWICGHIHEGRGTKVFKDTLYVNAAALTEHYKPHNTDNLWMSVNGGKIEN